MNIHPTAVVDPSAKLGADVTIGPYAVVGKDVTLGDRCNIGPHVTVEGVTTIGADSMVHQFASIGGPPQDFSYRGEDTRVEIGEKVTVREYVTIHRGTAKGLGKTVIGDGCFLMAYCHVAHDCRLGAGVVMANSAHLGGHIEVGEKAILGGVVAVHQFARVGEFSLVGGVSGVSKDVPPYTLANGPRIYIYGLNEVGLRRNGFSRDTILKLKKAFKIAFRSSLKVSQAVEKIRTELHDSKEALRFAEFLVTSNRGIAKPHISGRRA